MVLDESIFTQELSGKSNGKLLLHQFRLQQWIMKPVNTNREQCLNSFFLALKLHAFGVRITCFSRHVLLNFDLYFIVKKDGQNPVENLHKAKDPPLTTGDIVLDKSIFTQELSGKQESKFFFDFRNF